MLSLSALVLGLLPTKTAAPIKGPRKSGLFLLQIKWLLSTDKANEDDNNRDDEENMDKPANGVGRDDTEQPEDQ